MGYDFEDMITVYHSDNGTDYSRATYDNVHFESTKGVGISTHGVQNVSTGLVIIPTTEELEIYEKDILIPKLVEKSITTDYRISNLQKDYKCYTVVAVDDLRKGGLQHYEVTLK